MDVKNKQVQDVLCIPNTKLITVNLNEVKVFNNHGFFVLLSWHYPLPFKNDKVNNQI